MEQFWRTVDIIVLDGLEDIEDIEELEQEREEVGALDEEIECKRSVVVEAGDGIDHKVEETVEIEGVEGVETGSEGVDDGAADGIDKVEEEVAGVGVGSVALGVRNEGVDMEKEMEEEVEAEDKGREAVWEEMEEVV